MLSDGTHRRAFALFTSRSYIYRLIYNRPKIELTFFFAVTKFIRIGIADKNDNPPYFDKELYEAEVDENEDIQHTVLTVTAKDHDECTYLVIVVIIFCHILCYSRKKLR